MRVRGEEEEEERRPEKYREEGREGKGEVFPSGRAWECNSVKLFL